VWFRVEELVSNSSFSAKSSTLGGRAEAAAEEDMARRRAARQAHGAPTLVRIAHQSSVDLVPAKDERAAEDNVFLQTGADCCCASWVRGC
jgi:hypothetical protein